jgi:hypothetical protein
MPQLNDLSRSLVALDQDSTIIAVVETENSAAKICEPTDISTRYWPGTTIGPPGGSAGSASGVLRGGARLKSSASGPGYLRSHTNRLSPGRTDGRLASGKLKSSLRKRAIRVPASSWNASETGRVLHCSRTTS